MSNSKGIAKNRFLEQIVGGQRIRWRILREQSPGSQVLGFTLKDRVGKNCGKILYYWSIIKSQIFLPLIRVDSANRLQTIGE